MHGRVAIITTLGAALLLVGCAFDPLEGWQAPQWGWIELGDAIGPAEDALADDADVPPPPPPFRIDRIEPERGDPLGDEPILIEGTGFVSPVEVWFGESQGTWAQAQEGVRLTARTPAHEPGVVDVRVVNGDGREAVLQGGFLFGRPLRIDDIAPAQGPAAGGTPFTLRGDGFLPGTVAVIGGRVPISLKRLDEGTLIGVTPGGLPGPADVIVTNAVGSARARGAFRYEGALRLDAVSPAGGPADQTNEVTLLGEGLGGDVAVVLGANGDDGHGEPLRPLSWTADGRRAVVAVPPGPAGPLDIVASHGERGADELLEGFHRLAPDTALRVLAIVPDSGSAAGGETVTIYAAGLAQESAAETPVVTLGGVQADVLASDAQAGTIHFVTPPGSEGEADVTVRSGDNQATLPSGFRYRAPLTVTAVAPASGAPNGGETVTVRGVGFAATSASPRVFFGPLPCSALEVVDGETIRCVAPPGSPGPIDVRVVLDGDHGAHAATLAGGYTYEAGGLQLYAIRPVRGGRAGGTYVELYGADIPENPTVRFGHLLAHDVTRVSSSLVIAYAPPARGSGAVDVALIGGAQADELPRGWTYFDPRGPDIGSWGDIVDGAVNVTVIAGRQNDPLPNAFVMLGSSPSPAYSGWTDQQGQVTLSGPGLAGPVTVTASAIAHSAATLVDTDAENVVLKINPDNPPSTGGSTGGTTLPNGQLEGRVEGVVKYVPVPRSTCDDRPDDDPLCRACETDEDCASEDSELPDLRCSAVEPDDLRCTSACQATGCPAGYDCVSLDGALRCVPSKGTRQVTCEITRRGPFWSQETEPIEVDPTTGLYRLDSRLGEVAIVCFGGYETWEDGQFVPTRMGVKRHVFAESGELLFGNDVALDIPLTRTVRFQLDPSAPAEGEPDDTRVSVHLDLGPDGAYTWAESVGTDERGDVVLARMPESFTGSLEGAGLAVYAGRYTEEGLTDTPYVATYQEDLDDDALDLQQVLVERPEGWSFEDIVPNRQPRAVWQGPNGVRWVVGEGGALLRWAPGQGWMAQPALGDRDLNDIHGANDEDVVAVGDGGTMYGFRGLGWLPMDSPTARDLRAVWVAGPERFVAVGDHRVIEYDAGEWTVLKLSADLWGVSGRHWEDVWAVGTDGDMLHRGPNGWERVLSPTERDLRAVWVDQRSSAGFAVGDRGTVLHVDGGAWEPAWLGPDAAPDLRDVHARGPFEAVAVGARGALVRYDGAGWTVSDADAPASDGVGAGAPTMDILSVYIADSGDDARWTAVGPRAVRLGPMLPVPRFQTPRPGLPWSGRRFEWTIGEPVTPGESARALFLDVVGATGGTRWQILTPTTRTSLELPDLRQAAGFSPIPSGTPRLRAQSALWPGFDIDNARWSSISWGLWVSWTYDYLQLD